MPERVIERWHRVLEDRDPGQLNDLLAEDAVFHSPVMHTPQHGRPLVAQYLTAAGQVLLNDSFRYVREIVDGRHAALEFSVTIDDVIVNGVDLISWNEAGEITAFKVMLRPLKAISLVRERMSAMLESTAPE